MHQPTFVFYFEQALHFLEYGKNLQKDKQSILGLFMLYRSMQLCYKVLGIIAEKPLFKSAFLYDLHVYVSAFFPSIEPLFEKEILDKLSQFRKENSEVYKEKISEKSFFPLLESCEKLVQITRQLFEGKT